MPLFNFGEYVLSSGGKSDLLIDCSVFTPETWAGWATYAARRLPPFGRVEGVPRGGLPFAEALSAHAVAGCNRVLICDDVWTTGRAMYRHRLSHPADVDALGVVVFARSPCPSWVTPLLYVPGAVPNA